LTEILMVFGTIITSIFITLSIVGIATLNNKR